MINHLKYQSYNATKFRWFYRFIFGLLKLFRSFSDPQYRSRIIYSSIFRNNYLQFSNHTSLNRYPDLFNIAKEHFIEFANPKILSFGCSSGEEIQSLFGYLPNANFVGVDINNWCIRQAKRKFESENVKFYNSLSSEFQNQRNFDAIFALAVFQHPQNRHHKNQTLSAMPFHVFEKQLEKLSQKLNPGGLLFLDQLDFNFMETSLMKEYKIYKAENNLIERARPIFNKNGEKIAPTSILYRVFQKKEKHNY